MRPLLVVAMLVVAPMRLARADDCAQRAWFTTYDCAAAGTTEWEAGGGAVHVSSDAAPRRSFGAAHVEARWWPVTGGMLGVRQSASVDAPAAYRGLSPSAQTSGFDDLVLEAAYMLPSADGRIGARLEARLPTAANDLSRNRIGGTLAPVVATWLGCCAELSLEARGILRPVSRFGRTDIGEIWILPGLAGTPGILRWAVSAGMGQAYESIRGAREGHLAGQAEATLAVRCRDLALGIALAARYDAEATPPLEPALPSTTETRALAFVRLTR